MMLYPSVNKLREKVDSRYTLCMLAAKRARDLIAKKPALTEVQSERPVSQAANEIAEDLITYRRVENRKRQWKQRPKRKRLLARSAPQKAKRRK
mgnify:CR=1 FL=1